MSHVSFDVDGFIISPLSRRVGRPRQQFLQDNLTSAFYELFDETYDEDDLNHRIMIQGAAYAYDI